MKINFIATKDIPKSWYIPQSTPTKYIAVIYEDDDVDKKYPMYEPVPPNVSKDGYQLSKLTEVTGEFVFIVMRNSDFTEGRGPMLFDSVFASRVKAEEYIASQTGVYDSEQYRQIIFGTRYGDETVFSYIQYNGYDIIKTPLRK